jgi:hypothetical protein
VKTLPDAVTELRNKAEYQLRVAITFVQDGAFLDAICSASQAIPLLVRCHAARFH